MTWLRRIVRRLRGVMSRTDARDVRDELQLHMDLLADEYRAQGLSDGDARARATREFGNTTSLTERTRAVTTYLWLEGLLRDVVYASRQLRKTPGVTLLAVTSLAVGIGANTAVFAVVNALVLRSLPVPNAERLVALSLGDVEQTRIDGARWSYALWHAFSEHRSRFDGVMAWSPARVTVSQDGTAVVANGVLVNGEFFATLQVPTTLGRTIVAADDSPTSPPVAVISHGYWQRHFGGIADVVGRTLDVRGTSVAVVGVTPPWFTGLEVGQAFDFALPLSAEPLVRGAQSFLEAPFDRMIFWLRIGARLKREQSLDGASALVRGLQPQLREASFPTQFPELKGTFLQEPFRFADASNGLSRLRNLYRQPLYVLLAIVGLVLVLACLNVANLLLGQATARGRELALRLALGASRWRVARQLLVESALLTAVGVAAAVLISRWAARALVAQFSSSLAPVSLNAGVDWRVLLATSAIGILATFVCGTAAALRVRAEAPWHAADDTGHMGRDGRRSWATNGLLTAQVAMSLTVVITAGLFINTFVRLTTVPLGIDRESVLIANVNALRSEIPPSEAVAAYQRLVEAVRVVPGVAQAAASTSTPVSVANAPVFVTPMDSSGGTSASAGEAKSVYVTRGWFQTYGLPFIAGRDIQAEDSESSPPIMVVNRAFVERFFPGSSGLGESSRIGVGARGEKALLPRTVVGIVGNAVYQSPREAPQPTIYIPLTQYDYPLPVAAGISIGVRSAAGVPAALAKDVSTAIAAVNPRLTVTTRTLSSQVSESLRQEHVLARLSTLLGAMALFLAATGLFGVTSYGVARRRSELAVRIALGASGADVIRDVVLRVVGPVALGLAGGAVLSTWLARFVSTLFFGVTPGDPTTLLIGTLALTSTALVAGWIPARRALRIDPVEALRSS